MYEYRIIKNDRGWIIYRKKQIGKLLLLQYLNGHLMRSPNKGTAKTFYSKDSAADTLIIMKAKDKKPEE